MSPQAGFILQEEIRPRLISAIPNSVSFIAPEDAEELVQDGVAMAAKMIHNAENNGKKVVRSPSSIRGNQGNRGKEVTAGNIAYYTIQKLKCGRRSTGFSVADTMATGTQINGRTRLTSLDDVASGDEHNGEEVFEFHDVLASGEEDPGIKAARKMDWDSFMGGLSERDKAIIHCIVEGEPLATLARKRHLNNSTIMYHKERLGKAIAEYMGCEILVDIQRRPGWKNNINCTRERLACREERRRL
jgi:hypothetical protein